MLSKETVIDFKSGFKSPIPPPALVPLTDTDKELDPRVRRTRQLIEKAFFELMFEKDFQTITVQDIATRATVNRATFYAHFVDKYALLDHCLRGAFRGVLYSRLSVTSEVNIANLRLLILTVFEFLGQFNGDCPGSLKQFDPLVETQVQTQLDEFVLAWFKQLGEAKQPQFAEITADTVSWAIFGAGLQWSHSKKQRDAEEIANHVLSLLMGGLTQSLGIK